MAKSSEMSQGKWRLSRSGWSARAVSSPRDRLYRDYLIILFVAFIGTWAISVSGIGDALAHVPAGFWVLGALAVVVDMPFFAPLRPGHPATVFPSLSFTFAMSFGWGGGSGRSAQAAAILVGAVLSRREGRAVLFDLGRYGLALAAVSLIGVFAGHQFPVTPSASRFGYVLAAAAAWYGVFRLLTATGVWLRMGGSWRTALVSNVRVEALSAATLLVLSPMLFAITQVNAWLIPLVLVPLYTVSTMSRLWYEQAQRSLVDSLTGLPNWAAMARQAEREIAQVGGADQIEGRADNLIALLVVDLHQFHVINEALGYRVADQLLVAVGRRLAEHAAADTAVCHLKSDEFGLLRTHLSNEDGARAAADAIHGQLAEPFTIDHQQLVLDVSIGIAIYPQHGENFDVLAQHADTALQHAKELPPGVAVFQPGAESSATRRWELLEDLRRVLDQPVGTELVPYYQPQVDLATDEVVGVEALLRWQHPSRGMVDPEQIIQAAEHSPLMQKITRRMIEQVLRQLKRWRSEGVTVRASVNVSIHDLYARDFVPWLRRQLHGYGIEPAGLQLEITESALMTQPANVLDSLRSLRQLGVGAALDDFGTGFSSLEHLRRLPLTEVKIDRSFIQSMVEDDDAEAIVRAIIDLGASLALRVVAEGVEDDETRQRLLADGCRVAQGWYYAKALPGPEFHRWFTAHDAKARRTATAS